MKAPVYQIDAFAGRVFAGNPAIVCCLERWPGDALLLNIACEHNAAVAFLVDRGDDFEIRYFMPIGELPLIGHASLAAAHVLFSILRPGLSAATLRRRSGTLEIARLDRELFAITLPAITAQSCAPPAGLAAALGVAVSDVRSTDYQYFVFLDSHRAVAALAPDMAGLMRLDRDGVIATAPGDECEFVSRAFAPKEGLPEDPVCGSAHLALVPYWSDRLKRNRHLALQLSPRGGELHCMLEDGRVRLAGRCARYMDGVIHI